MGAIAVEILSPGTESSNPDYPDETLWTFSAVVDGVLGQTSGYFPIGTDADTAAEALLQTLADDPGQLEGIPVSSSSGTSGGGGSSPGGEGTGPAGSGEQGSTPYHPEKTKAQDEDDLYGTP